jgi:CHASE2 domain-containing sensor protein
MEPSEADAPRPVAAPADRLEGLSASARGWHTIQMAVLGFIGICGVLRTTDSPAPRTVQLVAAALAVAALAAASLAVFSVGRVAYPSMTPLMAPAPCGQPGKPLPGCQPESS